MTKSFSKILIANRGEIAVRVMRTARSMGYRTVAVFSDADADALYVREADEAVRIGPAPVAQSYLSIDKVIAAAKQTGADAIHPGYGFLSENAAFAEACEAGGIAFIGPPVNAIHLMGSKRLSKIAMIEAGVPCIPGYEGADQDDATLIAAANAIGAPIMVKASAGGGGKGMRLVHDLADLPKNIARARSEARNAFGSDELILERALIEPRHVEIQVFADSHGNVVYLGERDCSIQRRHQKVVEESPSPAVDPDLRKRMGAAAVRAAASCGYCGAGTVEFLLDKSGAFYFLEMNTRLQVEHPVTEMVTGLDLVEWQIRVAAGEVLPLTQDQVRISGHAIEVRLYAEDPRRDFTPQTGRVVTWDIPVREGLRVDTGVAPGQVISAFYDPMIAKVIAHGPDRKTAARRLASAISDIRLFGLATNRGFLLEILRHPAFLEGTATTDFIARNFSAHASLAPVVPRQIEWALAGAILAASSAQRPVQWHNGDVQPQHILLAVGETVHSISINFDGSHTVAHWDDERVAMVFTSLAGNRAAFEVDGHRRVVDWYQNGTLLSLDLGQGDITFEDRSLAPPIVASAAGSGRLVATMDGAIIALHRAVGDKVRASDAIVTLEAMKMEQQILAGVDGTVAEIAVKTGDQVKNRQLLAAIVPDAA